MGTTLTEADQAFLLRTIEISQQALIAEGKTPFAAIVVTDGEIVGEGTSRVVELHDPTAHAEVMALRDAGTRLGTHLIPDGIMYCSSEPCPMCLIACYWAKISRVVCAATTHDVATMGFEDLWFYRELTQPPGRRTVPVDHADGTLHQQAIAGLRAWADQLPFDVIAKY